VAQSRRTGRLVEKLPGALWRKEKFPTRLLVVTAVPQASKRTRTRIISNNNNNNKAMIPQYTFGPLRPWRFQISPGWWPRESRRRRRDCDFAAKSAALLQLQLLLPLDLSYVASQLLCRQCPSC